MPYHLGLPQWAVASWQGRYFDQQPSALASYAKVFNCVEGNTTFYQIPSVETVALWRRDAGHCRMVFKLPQTVTHQNPPAWRDLDDFVAAIAPLEEQMGPMLLLFPARIGPEHLEFMDAVFRRLPRHWRYVLEVRHPEFFAHPHLLEPLLKTYQLGKVVLDARPLHKGDPNHTDVLNAKHKKPRLPVIPQVYNQLAYIRLSVHPDSPYNKAYIHQWVEQVADYLRRGVETYMTFHCPNKDFLPQVAKEFHQALMAQPNLPSMSPLPDWPVPQQKLF